MSEAIVSGCDPAEVFDAPEHALDGIAVAIKSGREAIFPAAIDLGRDVRRSPFALDFATDGIAIVAFVAI